MPDILKYCCDCGSQFLFTNGEQRYFKKRGFSPPKRCTECRDSKHRNNHTAHRKEKDVEEIECCDCEEIFYISAKQLKFYEKKGFDLPKRCQSCKEKKKAFHKAVKEGFEKHHVTRKIPGIVHCEWCGNQGHSESYCRLKQYATCVICGKVGYPASEGFARGLRNNTFRRACDCTQK